MDTLQRPISRTEICQRVRGIIAERWVCSPGDFTELSLLNQRGVWQFDVPMVVGSVEAIFGIRLDEFHVDTMEFVERVTVGELISLVEGAVSGGTQ